MCRILCDRQIIIIAKTTRLGEPALNCNSAKTDIVHAHNIAMMGTTRSFHAQLFKKKKKGRVCKLSEIGSLIMLVL